MKDQVVKREPVCIERYPETPNAPKSRNSGIPQV
jgi:hypothetical protein